MKTFNELIKEAIPQVKQLLPWDLEQKIVSDIVPLIIDVREAYEFEAMHINNSIFIPRGILEQACEWDYDTTVPKLVNARDKEVIIVCRSGTRSVLAALTLQQLGYKNVYSLQTGVRGWNDYDQPLFDIKGVEVDADDAEEFLENKVSAEQLAPVN